VLGADRVGQRRTESDNIGRHRTTSDSVAVSGSAVCVVLRGMCMTCACRRNCVDQGFVVARRGLCGLRTTSLGQRRIFEGHQVSLLLVLVSRILCSCGSFFNSCCVWKSRAIGSSIGHPSTPGHRTLDIHARSSDIGHSRQVIGHSRQVIGHSRQVIGHRTSDARSSDIHAIGHRTSDIHATDIGHLRQAIGHPRHGHLRQAIGHRTSDIHATDIYARINGHPSDIHARPSDTSSLLGFAVLCCNSKRRKFVLTFAEPCFCGIVFARSSGPGPGLQDFRTSAFHCLIINYDVAKSAAFVEAKYTQKKSGCNICNRF